LLPGLRGGECNDQEQLDLDIPLATDLVYPRLPSSSWVAPAFRGTGNTLR